MGYWTKVATIEIEVPNMATCARNWKVAMSENLENGCLCKIWTASSNQFFVQNFQLKFFNPSPNGLKFKPELPNTN